MSDAQIAALVAAMLALAGAARWLRLRESRIDDVAKARALAEERLAGFVATAALVSSDGSAAIVAGAGTVALLKRNGARVAARRLIPPLILGPAIEGVRVHTGDPSMGSIVLLDVVLEDVRALEASTARN
jgi:hypothetical protein